MSDPSSLELQKAIVARLKADAAVAALVGDRIYDRVPPAAEFPYVSLGPGQVVPEYGDCYEADEVIRQIDVWSRAVGSVEAQRIAGTIRAALNDAPLVLSGHRLLEIRVQASSNPLSDPDGATTHVPLSVRALTEPV